MRLLVTILIVSCCNSWADKTKKRSLEDPKLMSRTGESQKILETKVETVKTGKDAINVAVQALKQNQEYFYKLLSTLCVSTPAEENDLKDTMCGLWEHFRLQVLKISYLFHKKMLGDKGSSFIKSYESIKMNKYASEAWMTLKNASNILDKEISELYNTILGSSKPSPFKDTVVPIFKRIDKVTEQQANDFLRYPVAVLKLLNFEREIAKYLSGFLKEQPTVYSKELTDPFDTLQNELEEGIERWGIALKEKIDANLHFVADKSLTMRLERISDYLGALWIFSMGCGQQLERNKPTRR